MPEFIPILIAGLLVFTALLLVFGGLIVPVSESISTSDGTSYDIGKNLIEIADNIQVSDVSDKDTIKRLKNITVLNGIASETKERDSFLVEDVEIAVAVIRHVFECEITLDEVVRQGGNRERGEEEGHINGVFTALDQVAAPALSADEQRDDRIDDKRQCDRD